MLAAKPALWNLDAVVTLSPLLPLLVASPCDAYVDLAARTLDTLVQHFGVHQCVWASDWPYIKAPYRLDYGPMLKVFEEQFSAEDRQVMLWDAPKKHFGF